MPNPTNIKELFDHLNNIAASDVQVVQANVWATGEGINRALKHWLGDKVHIIHPDSSSIASPANCNDFKYASCKSYLFY